MGSPAQQVQNSVSYWPGRNNANADAFSGHLVSKPTRVTDKEREENETLNVTLLRLKMKSATLRVDPSEEAGWLR